MKQFIILSALLVSSTVLFSQSYVGAFSKDGTLWGYLDQSGHELIPAKYTKPTPFSSTGLACVYDPSDRKFKLIDIHGAIIPTAYENFEVVDIMGFAEKGFDGDQIVIKVKGQFGVIDKTGKTIHEPEYTKISDFYGDFAIGNKKNDYFLLKRSGEVIPFSEKMQDIHKFFDGRAPYASMKGLWGYVNDKGAVIIPAHYHGIGYFSNGLAWARDENKKIGFIDASGKWVIQPKYDLVRDFDPISGVAVVRVDHEFRLLKTNGEEIEVTGTTKIKRFNDGLAEAEKDNLAGFINGDGKWVVTPEYESTHFFVNGYGRIRKNGLWGMVDTKGNVVIQPTYQKLEEVFDNRAAFFDGNLWGYVDTKGTVIVEPKYASAKNFNNGYAVVKIGDFWGLIDVNGNETIKADQELLRLDKMEKVK